MLPRGGSIFLRPTRCGVDLAKFSHFSSFFMSRLFLTFLCVVGLVVPSALAVVKSAGALFEVGKSASVSTRQADPNVARLGDTALMVFGENNSTIERKLVTSQGKVILLSQLISDAAAVPFGKASFIRGAESVCGRRVSSGGSLLEGLEGDSATLVTGITGSILSGSVASNGDSWGLLLDRVSGDRSLEGPAHFNYPSAISGTKTVTGTEVVDP